MSNVTTSQKLKDHHKAWAYKFTNESDGTAETYVTKVDASALVAANGDGSERLTITKLLWSIASGTSATQSPSIKLSWSGDSGNTIVVLTGSGSWDLNTMAQATLKNENANTNGDILLSTVGFTANASYTLVVEGHKVAGYTSRESTDDGAV